MENFTPFILVLLGVCACVQLVKCTSSCKINGDAAYCSGVSLHQVPMLPSYITYADLSLNYISQIDEESFAGLEGLQVLDLGSQRVKRLVIKSNAFRRLSNLTYLHLGDNRGIRIDPDAFQGLSNLRTLVLLHSDLDESILSGKYLKSLVSLERLQLFGNAISKIQPAVFFLNMAELHMLDLSLNQVNSICEADLVGLRGKHFSLLKLSSTYLKDMDQYGFNWAKCGNPFRNMSMSILDLSLNGFNVDKAELFFKAITGTKIDRLILERSTMGRAFAFNNTRDPDRQTFEGLKDSEIKFLDLSRSYIYALEFSVFSPLRELQEITLASNHINKIETKAFFGLTYLQKLNLSYNLLGEVYSETFENLPNLQVLDLSYNHIGVLAPNSFSGLLTLLALDLTGNSLRTVDKFAPLPNLQVIHLDDNKITSLYRLPNAASNAIIIKLDKNRLRNVEDLYIIMATFPYVEHIYLGGNFFSWCAHNGNNSMPPSNILKVLDLQSSALQVIWADGNCLDVFDDLGQLLQLFLSRNSLQSLPEGIFRGLKSLDFLDLSFNSLTYLPQNVFPESLKVLDLSYNFLSSPDPNLFRFLNVIDLKENRFLCDCSLRGFQSWMNATNVTFFSGVEQLTCQFPEEQLGVSLLEFGAESCEEDEDDETRVQELRLSLFVSCAALLALITIGAVAGARFRGHLFVLYKKVVVRVVEGSPRASSPDGFRYDAYLCFSANDFKWVEAALLRRLDSQFSEQNLLRCCFEERDFIPGGDHLSNMRDAIWGSKKTVCVVSKEFLKDGWCLEAFTLAQTRMLDELKDTLVVVVIGNMPQFRLMKYEPIRTFIQNREYLQWPEDSQDVEWFYDKLTMKIVKDKKVKQKRSNDVELQSVRPVTM